MSNIWHNYGEYIEALKQGKHVSPAQFGLGSALADTQGFSELSANEQFLEDFYAGGNAVDLVKSSLKNPYGLTNVDADGIDQGFNQAAVSALDEFKTPLADVSEFDIKPIGDWSPSDFVPPEGAITQAQADQQFADSQDGPFLPGSSSASNAMPPIATREDLQTIPSSEVTGPVFDGVTPAPAFTNSPAPAPSSALMMFDEIIGNYWSSEQSLPSTLYQPANLNPSIAINDKILHAVDSVRQHQDIKREVDIYLASNAVAQFDLTFGNVVTYYNAQLGKSIAANTNGTTTFI